jgi:hypothetical protein
MGNGHVDQGSARRASTLFREVWLRSRVTVTWTRAQPGGLKHIANREIVTPMEINIMSSKVPNSQRVKSRWDLNRWIKH